MNYKIENGQTTFCFGNSGILRDGKGSGHNEGFRIQIYYPIIKWKSYDGEFARASKELYLSASTVFRFVWEENFYFGIGGQILGFGLGIDYQKDETK